jgi:hypothetical protein
MARNPGQAFPDCGAQARPSIRATFRFYSTGTRSSEPFLGSVPNLRHYLQSMRRSSIKRAKPVEVNEFVIEQTRNCVSPVDVRVVMQNDIQQGTVNLQVAVIINEAQLAKLVHEETHP